MRWNRAIAVVTTASAMPLLSGCVYDNWQPRLEGFDNQNTGRATMMATQYGKTTKAVMVDKSRVDLVKTSTGADYEVLASSFTDIKGMTPSSSTPGLYYNSDATAYVMPQPDADGNGREDTFFVATEYNLPGQRNERTMAYFGPFTPYDKLWPYAQGQMKATYTGKGGVMGTIGSDHVSAEGPLTMHVDFGRRATIDGRIELNGAPQVQSAEFSGRLTTDLTDFTIESAHLNTPTRNYATQGGYGVGSFIGDKGQGTMGAFSISSQFNGTSDIANVQGWFIGSADSLK